MKLTTRNISSTLLQVLILIGALFAYTPARAATLTSINVAPANSTIVVGQTQAFTATGTFSDASTRSLTAGDGAWNAVASMSLARARLGVGAVDGMLYAVGGSDALCTTYSALEAYHPASDTWAPKSPMPTARASFGTAVDNGLFYVIGGQAGCGTPIFNTVEAYDPVTDAWNTLAPIPTERIVPGTGVIGGILYVVGGQNYTTGVDANGNLNTLEAYDPGTDTWTTKAPMPTARAYVGTAVYDNKLYVLGGMNSTQGILNTVEVYDPQNDSWTTAAPMPTAEYGFNVAVVNGMFYLLDGVDSSDNFVSAVAVYNPAADTWSTLSPASVDTRYVGAAGVINGTVYAVGGLACGNGCPTAAVDAYTPPEVLWSSSSAAVATIDHAGLATAASSGTTTVTATAGAVSGDTTLTVVQPAPADLVISSITASPSPAAVGETVTLSATVTNAGAATASNFEVDLYKNLRRPPAPGQTGDVVCLVPTLAPGDTTTCSGQVSYDAAGTYVVWAQADLTNVVPETNETNNSAHIGLAVRQPDLRITALTAPSGAVTIGQSVTLTATVTNASAVDVINTFSVDIYKNLASAPGAQPGDITCTVTTLAPQASATCSGTVTYSATGAYKVWAQADTTNTVTETHENNNVAGPVTVNVALPDLIILSVRGEPPTVSLGQSITLLAYVRNAGTYPVNTPFTLDVYANSASAPTPTQVGDVTCTIPSLAVGGTATCSGSYTYSAPGTYQIWAQADRSNAIVETNETNNVGGPFIMTIE
jgi:N-acetylneuraminic acid mutarotase